MSGALDLVAYNRKWLRLHEHNKYQAEAARRITALLAEVVRLRDDRDRWKQAYEMADPLLTDRDRLAATVARVEALHFAEPYAQGQDYCNECEQRWPCDTSTALKGDS